MSETTTTTEKKLKKIGTHGSTFHLDDALSCFMLRCLPEYQEAVVLRSADAAKLISECDIVVDIGGVYDHSRKIYDHHQRGYFEFFCPETSSIKMAATGLIWRHYGKDIIQQLWPKEVEQPNEDILELLHKRVYIVFLSAIDAGDNGIDPYPKGVFITEGIEPLYSDHTTLAHRVKMLNPQWNEGLVNSNERFLKASLLAGNELKDFIDYQINSWLPGRNIVKKAFENRFNVHPSGRVIAFTRGESCPFKDHLYDLENEERKKDPNFKNILYSIMWDGGRNQWGAIAIGPNAMSFACRLAFPPSWRGLTDTTGLGEECNIPESVFVHSSGFLACNTSYEGILKMISSSMELQQSSL